MPSVPRQKLPRRRPVERDRYIMERCRDKSVLHVGCCDSPFAEEKFKAGTLLHSSLVAMAKKVVGIDLDADSVNWMLANGFEDIYECDAADSHLLLEKIHFSPDAIVAGEVLEHLSSPVQFLESITTAMGPETELLISVPNAFWGEGFLHVLTGKEKVHEEHVCYYSYHTLKQMVDRAGLKSVEIIPSYFKANASSKKLSDALLKPLTWISPHFSPGYVMTAKGK